MSAAAPAASTINAEPAPPSASATKLTTARQAGMTRPRRTTVFMRSTRRAKTVAGAANGFDHPVGAVRLERHAQPSNVHVDGAFLDVNVIAPHLVQELRARMHPLRSREEIAQQLELGRTHRHVTI